MKKALSNLKKSVPPKARIAILTAFLGIGVIAYLIFSILTLSSAEDTPASNGLVKVDTIIEKETKVAQSNLLSTDNSINQQIAELNKKELDAKKSDENNLSHFDGISLDNRRDLNKPKVETQQQNNDVVDLGSLFAETEEEKKEREERKQNRIEDLEATLEIPQSSQSTIQFDRNAYIDSVTQEFKSTGQNNPWEKTDAIANFTIKSYSNNESSKSGSAPPANTNNLSSPTSTINKSTVDKRRNQYMSRYNTLKSDLEKRVNGNTETIASNDPQDDNSNDAFKTKTSQGDDDYPSNKRYGAGEIIYAINDIEIVSNETNVVRATVAQNGDTYNAILLGEFTQIGDVMGISFSSYTVDGKSYPINAVAIDAETWKSGMADDVDKHYFERYFGIIAAAMLEGYAETLTNKSQVSTDNGFSESQEKIEKTSERFQYAIGKVGEYLAPQFLEGMTKPSTVTVYRDRGMGIMFMADFRVPARK